MFCSLGEENWEVPDDGAWGFMCSRGRVVGSLQGVEGLLNFCHINRYISALAAFLS